MEWGDEAGGNRGKKTSGPSLAPGHIPCIALVLLPIPIRSPKRIQQTVSLRRIAARERRHSRITRLVEATSAGIASFLSRCQQLQLVLILRIMALAPSYH